MRNCVQLCHILSHGVMPRPVMSYHCQPTHDFLEAVLQEVCLLIELPALQQHSIQAAQQARPQQLLHTPRLNSRLSTMLTTQPGQSETCPPRAHAMRNKHPSKNSTLAAQATITTTASAGLHIDSSAQTSAYGSRNYGVAASCYPSSLRPPSHLQCCSPRWVHLTMDACDVGWQRDLNLQP